MESFIMGAFSVAIGICIYHTIKHVILKALNKKE